MKTLDDTVKKLCRKRITDCEEPLLGDRFSVTEAIAAAVIKRAEGGATDAVKLIRDILASDCPGGGFTVDVRIVD